MRAVSTPSKKALASRAIPLMTASLPFLMSVNGTELAEAYCAQLREKGGVIDAHLKWLRSELRTCFRFVRNDFMHNLRDLTEGQCLALVCRIADVYSNAVEAG